MFRKRKNSAMDQTNVERSDRTLGADSSDSMAGSEGIDEPSLQESMSTSGRGSRQQGREGSTDDAGSFSGQGNQRENSMDRAEGTGYTGNRGNMSGSSGRKLSEQESNTDKSDSENPLT